MDFCVQLRVVQVQHECWQLHYLEVKDHVPEHRLVLPQEALLEYDLFALLLHNVDVFFIQCYWRKHLDADPFPSFEVVGFVL